MDLQRLRHDYKLSQSELASILGCKQSNISTMENSSKPLSALNVKILIEKYTSIKVKNVFIVYFDETKDMYQKFRILNLQNLSKKLLESRICN